MIARPCSCVVSYLRLASVKDRDHPIGYDVCLVVFCDCAHSTWKWHASVSCVICSELFHNIRKNENPNAFLEEFMEFNFPSLRSPNVICWTFHSFSCKGAARCAKLKTNLRKNLHNPMNDQNFEIFFGASNLPILFVVYDEILRRQERKKYLK